MITHIAIVYFLIKAVACVAVIARSEKFGKWALIIPESMLCEVVLISGVFVLNYVTFPQLPLTWGNILDFVRFTTGFTFTADIAITAIVTALWTIRSNKYTDDMKTIIIVASLAGIGGALLIAHEIFVK